MTEERDVEKPIQDMERGEQQMEAHGDELEEHIEEAKKVAAQRQDAPEQGPAGDWEGEATGSSQGEDATDAIDEGSERP